MFSSVFIVDIVDVYYTFKCKYILTLAYLKLSEAYVDLVFCTTLNNM